MQERGVEVDPSTIMRWVHRYAPELEERVRWYQGYRAASWRVDETYVKGWWPLEVLVSGRRQAGPADRLHVVRPAKYAGCPSFPGQSIDDDASLAAVLDHYRPARLISEGYRPVATRRQAVGRHKTPDLQIPE
jgi:hypothetical protein